jgi:hypothetical protein
VSLVGRSARVRVRKRGRAARAMALMEGEGRGRRGSSGRRAARERECVDGWRRELLRKGDCPRL